MKKGESLGQPEFGREYFDKTRSAIEALNALLKSLSSDLGYISTNGALAEDVCDDPDLQQRLSAFRHALGKTHEVASEAFRSISSHMAHSQADLEPLETGGLGTVSQKISKQQRDQMLAERKAYFKITKDWFISTQFKNWIAPYASQFIDLPKELAEYCLYDGETFQELRSHTLITQCGTDIGTMRSEVARLSSTSDPKRERETYREAAGRAVQFFASVLMPFIESRKYNDEISRKFALLNITNLIGQARAIQQSE